MPIVKSETNKYINVVIVKTLFLMFETQSKLSLIITKVDYLTLIFTINFMFKVNDKKNRLKSIYMFLVSFLLSIETLCKLI